jgi:aspartyl-tRNA(Asn)/glutamyl-tRNA(Gln) amidotransferase subunit B
LPAARAARFEGLGLHPDRARSFAFNTELGDYFEQGLSATEPAPDAVTLSNWIPQLVERIGSDADPAGSRVSAHALATLAQMVSAKQISHDAGREVLSRLAESGGDPREVAEREGLGALGDESDGLVELVDRAIAADPAAAEQVRAGNARAIGPLVGYVMRETKGRADGGVVTRLIAERVAAQG